ncbi:hypothetical protein [Pseudoxanthomonas indica]|uniref:Uncharacterized protein n=1 Tax=Pseudoxanthomonas indica TaxID=428993 RepID=A0A1T5JET9_9GAMM|nr:hypothetical protein [Pseudoxanthomonas indica]GGD58173.1 hypothetical protein GCM10007235_33120 [Pseudoxanthomonas indica]SKC49728.1 hypothetical protein SAMN06296058_0734 [Pseudoxanthomonas indica]
MKEYQKGEPTAVVRVEVFVESLRLGAKLLDVRHDGKVAEEIARLMAGRALDLGTDSVSTVAHKTIPYELRAIGAEEVGILLGLAPRTVLETVACRPDFPIRLTKRPATWVAGEVLKWRDANRVD